MAIERIDNLSDDTDEKIGWLWHDVNGEEELISVEADRYVLVEAATGMKHSIHAAEIKHWIKALQKAEQYFQNKGIL